MQTGQPRRRRITRSQRATLVQRFEHERARSGMTAHAFSAREGISVASLYRWRALVAGTSGAQPMRPASPSPTPAPTAGNANALSAPAEFIDLGGLLGQGAPLTLRLELGAGIVLQLSRG